LACGCHGLISRRYSGRSGGEAGQGKGKHGGILNALSNWDI
jgi:hypothetical protein